MSLFAIDIRKKSVSVAIVTMLLVSVLLVAGWRSVPAALAQSESVSIELDQPYYIPLEIAEVTVNDPSFAGNFADDEIDVVITSQIDNEGITLHIFEGGDDVADDGVFKASFEFADGGEVPSTPPFLSVALDEDGNDVVTATYVDGFDNISETTADFVYPVPFFDAIRYDGDDQAVMNFPNPPLDMLNDAETDTLSVFLESDTDFAGFDVTLTETGVATNTFLSNDISFTTTGDSDPNPDGPILRVTDGDRIHGSFHLGSEGGPSFFTIAYFGPAPTITLDSEAYEFDDTATVTVNDLFATYDEVPGSVLVEITSDCDEGGIGLELDETATGSGGYVGTFDFVVDSESSGNTLEVCGGEGGNIQTNYSSDATNEEAFDSAFVGPSESSGITITSVTPAFWGVKVGVSGTSTVFGGDAVISIDFGDDTIIDDITPDEEDGSWSLDPEDSHAYSSDDVGEEFNIIAIVAKSSGSCECTLETPSEPFPIVVLKHSTIIDPNFENEDIVLDEDEEPSTDFRSALETKKFTVGGTLYDEITGEELGGKVISYTGTGATPLSTSITQGMIFEHPDSDGIVTVECSNSSGNCSQDHPDIFGFDPDADSNVVVHLKSGGKIIFPPNTLDVQIYLQDMGFATFDWKITEGNGAIQTGTTAAAGPGALVIPILGYASGSHAVGSTIVPNGLAQMEIISVDSNGAEPGNPDPDASVGIAGLVTHDITANAQYTLSFESESIGEMDSPYEVHPGAFFAIGTAPAVTVPGAPTLDKTIQMTFDGSSDPLYDSSNPSTSPEGKIDILPDTSGIAGAIATGGAATTVIDDAGNDIVQYSCAVGNDVDGDIVCDNWEESGIIDVGNANYVLCGDGLAPLDPCDGADGLFNTKDIYVEVDAQSGNMFADSVFTSIKNVFTQAPTLGGLPFKLHLIKDESTIDPALFPTKMWKDTSSSWLNGQQVNTITDGAAGDLSRQIKIKGLDVFTTGPVTSQKLALTVRLTFSADPGTLGSFTITNPSAFVSANLDTRGQLVSVNTAVVNTAGITSPSVNVRLVPITITYSTTTVSGDGISDTSAQGRLGTTTITFNLGAGKTAVTLNTAAIGPGSQLITSNDDFDGIKRAYFGRSSERDGAGGSFGQERANLVAKAQVYHYGLLVRNTGNTKILCGNSGHSEAGGNDFVVSLGQKQTSTSNTTPINCFTGPNGSDNEQLGTFVHELGHNFGFKHGGGDDDNCKPNYPSLMSYSRQIPIPGFGTWTPTYSRELLAPLDETSTGPGISEATGIFLSGTEWAANTSLNVIFGRLGAVVVLTIDNIVGTSSAFNFDGDGTSNEILKPFDINFLSGVLGCNTANNKALAGFDDWANIDLNFKDGKPIDGVYPITGQGSEHNDKTVKSMIKAGNKGEVSGLLQPINQVYLNDLHGISQYKKGNTIPLKLNYDVPNANLYVKVVKLTAGVPSDAVTESTTPLAGDSGNKMRFTNGQYVFNLSTDKLTAPGTYGVEIWRDAVGTGTLLDNDTDGYAGFFALKN
jgi:hypothetical protein